MYVCNGDGWRLGRSLEEKQVWVMFWEVWEMAQLSFSMHEYNIE